LRRKKAPAVDISSSAEALGLLFSEEGWGATPIAVRYFIIEREKASIEDKKTIAKLSKRVEELEKRIEELLNRDSSNSDQPPSSDGPCRKPRASKKKEGKEATEEERSSWSKAAVIGTHRRASHLSGAV